MAWQSLELSFFSIFQSKWMKGNEWCTHQWVLIQIRNIWGMNAVLVSFDTDQQHMGNKWCTHQSVLIQISNILGMNGVLINQFWYRSATYWEWMVYSLISFDTDQQHIGNECCTHQSVLIQVSNILGMNGVRINQFWYRSATYREWMLYSSISFDTDQQHIGNECCSHQSVLIQISNIWEMNAVVINQFWYRSATYREWMLYSSVWAQISNIWGMNAVLISQFWYISATHREWMNVVLISQFWYRSATCGEWMLCSSISFDTDQKHMGNECCAHQSILIQISNILGMNAVLINQFWYRSATYREWMLCTSISFDTDQQLMGNEWCTHQSVLIQISNIGNEWCTHQSVLIQISNLWGMNAVLINQFWYRSATYGPLQSVSRYCVASTFKSDSWTQAC